MCMSIHPSYICSCANGVCVCVCGGGGGGGGGGGKNNSNLSIFCGGVCLLNIILMLGGGG